MPSQFDEIRTERLLMRRWRDSDREPFAELNGDAETMQFFPSTMDRAASDAFVHSIEARFEQRGYGLWALELAATGEFLGFTGLNAIPDGVPIPIAGGTEVGWRLRKQFWHHGYATEAARAAVDVGFTRAGLAEIWSFTAIRNEPSQAVMRRLGMTEHSFFEHPSVPLNSPLRPHVLYRLAREDWPR
jgi:RimJ/RimL family protein N-acetyltransferase